MTTDPTIIVGTARTASALIAQLRALGPTRHILGAVLVGPNSPTSLPVLGPIEQLPAIVRSRPVSTALVTLPRRQAGVIFQLRRQLRNLGIAERFIPSLDELIDPPDSSEGLIREPAPLSIAGSPTPLGRRIDLAALIERAPHPIDRAALARVVTGQRVLVTGAGGSIGSELARVCAALEPESLVLMDRSENALFEIDRQIARLGPHCAHRAVLCDVADPPATRRVLDRIQPTIVFHAAAHKHVPLMEDHPAAAVVNNVVATHALARASMALGVERFVLISTDKAVHPSSVMGATKRLAELTVQALAATSTTRFAIVRFGNVLGSAGSVIPIWTAQLAEGGPLIVTDPRMTRYFMTIPEAAGLVVQAASIDGAGPGAPVFVLDMGEPISILGLAQRFVRAHGLVPRVLEPSAQRQADPGEISVDAATIDIQLTGARPGEKLVEELAYEAEELVETAMPGIRVWTGCPADAIDPDAMLEQLARAAQQADHGAVRDALAHWIPELASSSSPGVAAGLPPLSRAG